ncbi:MAG: OmpW family outer membrane protein [Pseudomonadota bacterium]|nr:OmpW family outer membrane protein [Pseudomonadota bacterium]
MKKHMIPLAAMAGLLLAAPALWAQPAGSLLLRAGVISIQPDVESGNLSAPNFGPAEGTKIGIRGKTQIGGGVTYMLTDHLAVDMPLAMPFTHTIVGAGAIEGVGPIGTVKSLPATTTLQYRFNEPQSAFRPYVGAGLSYAYFFKQRMNGTFNALTGGTPGEATTSKTKSKLAPVLQVGAVYAFNERWFIDGSVTKAWLKTSSSQSSGQTISYRVDPWVFQLGVGYRF